MISLKEIKKNLADNMQVTLITPGIWKIESTIKFTDSHENTRNKRFSTITCKEEDYTGIFNGELYNPMGGFVNEDDLNQAAQNAGMTADKLLEEIWKDTANADNYEPVDMRNERLVNYFVESIEDRIKSMFGKFEFILER